MVVCKQSANVIVYSHGIENGCRQNQNDLCGHVRCHVKIDKQKSICQSSMTKTNNLKTRKNPSPLVSSPFPDE